MMHMMSPDSKVFVKDAEGNVLFEGMITRYSINTSAHDPHRRFSIEGIQIIEKPIIKVDVKADSSHMMESLQSLIKALEAGSYNAYPSGLVGGGPLRVEALDHDFGACAHEERKTYQGFTETYDYCERCGAKNI